MSCWRSRLRRGRLRFNERVDRGRLGGGTARLVATIQSLAMRGAGSMMIIATGSPIMRLRQRRLPHGLRSTPRSLGADAHQPTKTVPQAGTSPPPVPIRYRRSGTAGKTGFPQDPPHAGTASRSWRRSGRRPLQPMAIPRTARRRVRGPPSAERWPQSALRSGARAQTRQQGGGGWRPRAEAVPGSSRACLSRHHVVRTA